MGILKSVLILLVGAALATFLWSNYDQRVVISFTQYFRTIEIPLANALVAAMLLGFVLAIVLSLPNQFRHRARARELKRRVAQLEKENSELRQIPLSDSLPTSVPSASSPSTSGGAETPGTGNRLLGNDS